MHIHSVSSSKERKAADVIVLPFWSDKKKPISACDCKEFDPLIKFPIDEGDFLGKEGETLLLYQKEGKEKRVLLLGLGAKKPVCPTPCAEPMLQH